jgi:hypothetical protein
MGFDISKLFNANAYYGITRFLKNLNSNKVNIYDTVSNTYKSTVGVNRSSYDRPFIIGFIPPDISVNFTPIKQNTGTKLVGKQVTIGSTASTGAEGTHTSLMEAVNAKTPEFWEKLVQMCDRLKMKPEDLIPVMFSESQFNPSAVCADKNGNQFAKGMTQISYSVYSKLMTKAEWDNFENLSAVEQLPYIEKYFKSFKFNKWVSSAQIYGANAGGGAAYNAGDPNFVLYDKDNTKQYRDNKGNLIDLYGPNKGLDLNNDGKIDNSDLQTRIDRLKSDPAYNEALKQVNAAVQRINTHTDTESVVSTTGPAGGVVVQEVGIMHGRMDNLGNEEDDPYKQLGRNISFDEKRELSAIVIKADMNEQIALISSTPSMLMYINPRSFSRNYEQSVDVAGGWRGQIVSIWLERPLKISGSGTTAAQYAVNASGFGGLTNLNKIYSLSYENLMSLVLIYQNNGWIFSGSGVDDSNKGVPVLGLNLFIYYDGHLYIGSFDSFKVSESADKPWNLDYSFEFTARYDVPLVDSAGEANLQGAV